ncbi:restriction endonuclease subunit S [Kocuria sp. NPDC057446]|uniref:restriction endonuclease subunit S n=1 Tax=Kocuria sp. NPDC057446 TaxID=3346137 RepID=UPI0036BB385C
MSRIDELVKKLAPNGVPRAKLGDIGEFIRGNGLQKSDLTNDGAPAIHYGQIHTHYGVWTNSTKSFTDPLLAAKLRRAQPGDLVIATTSEDDAAVAKATAWLGDGDVAVSGDAYIFRHTLEPRYVAYFFQSTGFQDQKRSHIIGTKVRRISGKSLAQIEIPIPPRGVQREIVRILDHFSNLETELINELQGELETRRAQYEKCRTQIFAEAWGVADTIELGQLGRIVTGRTPKASDASAWGSMVDFVTPSDIKNGVKTVSTPSRRLSKAGAEKMLSAIIPARSLLITCIGADMGKTIINAKQCITNQQINALIPDADVDVDYLFHVLTSMRDRLRVQGERGGGTMPIINKSDFAKIAVPIPSINAQKAIASKLDKLDGLVNDLNHGLRAELAARRKQYEYYRDRLLTFDESTA